MSSVRKTRPGHVKRRAAIYARVSSHRQQEQATIESQLADLRKRARQDGHLLEDDHILLDDGRSGTHLDRPGLDRLRDLASQRAIDLVYVHTPDRLARRYAHQVILMEEFEHLGCDVIFLDQVPAEVPEGQLLVQIQGVIAEYERAKIAERTRRGKLHRARQGAMIIGKAPFGYRHVRRDGAEASSWKINEEEAPMIRDLFAWVADEELSIRQAAVRLNASPWKTRGGRDHWPTSTVGTILTNETYTGVAYYNRRRWVESTRTDSTFRKTRKTRAEMRPREEWIKIPVPAIIDQDTFARVQKQLKKNKAFSRRNLKRDDEYLLRCLVSCGVCGQTMVAHSHGRHTYYHCTGAVDHIRTGRTRRCPAPRVYAPDLDQLVWEEIKTLLSSPQLIRESWQSQHDRPDHHSPDVVETELTRLNQRTAAARRQIQRLIDGYQAGFVRAAELSTRRASLEKEIAHWHDRRTTLEAQRPRYREVQKAWQSLDAFCTHATAGLENLTFDHRQNLLRKVIQRVWITAWDVKIKLAIPLSTNSHLTPVRVRDAEDAAAAPHRDVPGTALCLNDHPARHQRGRRPSGFLTNDHADGATLGRQGRPRRPELPGGLLTEERTGLLLSWRHSGFSVHNRVRVEPEDQSAVERLARYIMRPPISLERIGWSGDGEVLYLPKGGHDGRARQPCDPAEAFDPAEFLARVIMHIPEPRRHLVRYYGAYSKASRGKRKRQDVADADAVLRDGEHAPSARADRDRSPDARALRRS